MADETLIKKRITTYTKTVSKSNLTNSDVMFVDNPTEGTRKIYPKAIIDNTITSSGIHVHADSPAITDVNDQPVNTVYTYDYNLQSIVANLPSNKGAVILHYSHKYSDNTSAGQVMIAIERGNDEELSMYFRSTSGANIVWSNWKRVANISELNDAIDDLKADLNIGLSSLAKATGGFSIGEIYDGTIIFTKDDINEGDILYYDITAYDGYSGTIQFFNSSGNRLMYFGKASSSETQNTWKGTVVIPTGFDYAKVVASKSSTPYKLLINWISNTESPKNKIENIYDDYDKQADKDYIQKNLFESLTNGYSGRGITITVINDKTYHVSGTASDTILFNIGTATLSPDEYKIEGFALDSTTMLMVADSNNTTIGNSFGNGGVFKIESSGEYVIKIRINKGKSVDMDISPEIVSNSTLSNKELSSIASESVSVVNDIRYHKNFVTLKNRPNPIEGYDYVSFSSGCMWNEKETYAARAGVQHTTPESKDQWGKIILHTIDYDGNIEYSFMDFDYTSLAGEMRDPNLSVTRDGRLLLSAFMTNNTTPSSPTYSSIIIELDKDLKPIGYKTDIVESTDLIFGNTLQTPSGYLLKCAYDSNFNISIYRSTTPFTTISSLSFTKVSTLESNDVGTEVTIGYAKDKLICLIREENANAHLYVTDNLEGNGTWNKKVVTYDTNAFELHSPTLLPYYYSDLVVFAGSKKESAGRSPIIGYLDLLNSKIISYKKVYEAVTNSGYPGIVRLSDYEYGVIYYVDQIPGTSYHYRRINTMRSLNQLF